MTLASGSLDTMPPLPHLLPHDPRDLWTRFQFELAKELMPLKGAVDAATTDPARLRPAR